MDIENTHPFCLPFSLCHDATSSSIAGDFATIVHNNNNTNITEAASDNIKDKLRSKTSSPSDELFRHLNSATQANTSHSSLLNDDLIIESSTSLEDINGDDTFCSLELDIDIDEEDRIGADLEFSNSQVQDDSSEQHLIKANQDDWFCNQYFLLSPTGTHSSHNSRRKSLIKTALLTGAAHNHVFQHVFDPIDIKSSPTLAQLNLNSNDDPTDGLWDSAAPPANTDLLSNCTSISGAGSNHHTGAISITTTNQNDNNYSTCNHMHHHHEHHTHCNRQSYAHLSSNLSSSPSCHHIHHHHGARFATNGSTQSTCLAVTPFRKTDQHPFTSSPWCHNLLTTANICTNLNNGPNLKPSATLNQLNQQTVNPPSNRQLSDVVDKQRSASPALVTSSSSPLSSGLNSTAENRAVDNKLKENIEYLTALLCNGNKLTDYNNQQQPNISSSMAKSYTTLAHSLSTGPKLLERQHQQMPSAMNAQQQRSLYGANGQINGTINPTNEASPSNEGTHLGLNTQQVNALKRPYSDQWFKLGVESSVSAADSTESSGLGIVDQQRLQHQQQCSVNHQAVDQRQRSSDLKVLSSLLSAGKCTTSCSNLMPGNTNNLNHDNITWQQDPQSNCNTQTIQSLETIQVPSKPSSDHSQSKQASSPIPVNGKPITLTPIVNNNNLIIQQQAPKSRISHFAQPASPSASSTTSSGGNTDLGSTSSGCVKRQRGNNLQAPRNQKANSLSSGGSSRSVRPSSMSTDCSLSSHDEAFSSQIDNDDCGSGRDSDNDDDVDSDDESFYGDYTNNDLIGASISDNVENKWTLNMGRTRRNGQKRYFWQYNVQSKGPKGTRICSTDDSEDPFVLPEASDPVFSNDCQVEGVKHSGKARRGDGNDLTPNPRKLLMIGLELKKLGKIINDLAPVTDLPVNARNKTRKEKNKLASRACRLKKKAQHEANKIKLYGLQREHRQLVMAIYEIRKLLNEAVAERDTKERLKGVNQHEQLTDCKSGVNDNTKSSVKTIAEQCSMVIAGQTSDYVNSVLEKVVSGCIDGGLQT